VAAAATRGIALLAEEPHRRRELLEKADALRASLSRFGIDTESAMTQIMPIVVGAATIAVAMAAKLAEAGLFVPAIRPPSVPAGKSLLRVSLSWHHTPDDLERLATVIRSTLRDHPSS
jgi:8-amino-7-oxononanoate synthase